MPMPAWAAPAPAPAAAATAAPAPAATATAAEPTLAADLRGRLTRRAVSTPRSGPGSTPNTDGIPRAAPAGSPKATPGDSGTEAGRCPNHESRCSAGQAATCATT